MEKNSRALARQAQTTTATLWRLFPARDREYELSFLLLFVFSLRKRKKKERSERNDGDGTTQL